ncbi:MAG: hypothetical protein GY953_43815, partial [bacterium]|nr:hypothetical protein [bacterium]
MIESWVEIQVSDNSGNSIRHMGGLNDAGEIEQSPVIFKADGFDRKGELIDRHNLWDLVGVSYKRALYPGATDTVALQIQCPSMARLRLSGETQEPGRRDEAFAFTAPARGDAAQLRVQARLWYRKANPAFLDRIYGADRKIRSPITEISTATATIRIIDNEL